jgi:hypothetical protein
MDKNRLEDILTNGSMEWFEIQTAPLSNEEKNFMCEHADWIINSCDSTVCTECDSLKLRKEYLSGVDNPLLEWLRV